jgi:DNA polymerase-3 subunit chi
VTNVDFYITEQTSDEARLRIVCEITEGAYQRNQHVFIHSPSAALAKKLDELLWTFSQSSFIPHRLIDPPPAEPPPEPVLIGVGQEPVSERWNLLINLCEDVPEFFSRYERVAEVVDGDATRRAQSRERYRFYRDRGYPLATYKV